MNKKEKHQAINSEFIEKYEDEFDIDDEVGGRLILTPLEQGFHRAVHNTIEYHQSRHTVDAYNWAEQQIKYKVLEMEDFIAQLRLKYDLLD